MKELLQEFFKDYDTWTVWRQYVYADVMKKCIATIRRKTELFIINKSKKYFVLKNQEEANHYKGILKRDIAGMERSIIRADDWVKKEKWRNI